MAQLQSYIYKLYELRDERREAIEHLQKMAEDQVKMAEAFESSVHAEALKEVAEQCRMQGADYLKQKANLEEKVGYINSVLTAYESGLADENPLSSNKYLSNVTNSVVTYLFLGLGIVSNDPVTEATEDAVPQEPTTENTEEQAQIETTEEQVNESVENTNVENTETQA